MNVRVISERQGTTLIEWIDDGELRRALLPAREVSADGQVEFPERGLDYGLPWARFVTVEVTPEDIERSLKNAGIWTLEDLQHKPREAQGAIVAAFGTVLANLLRNVKHES